MDPREPERVVELVDDRLGWYGVIVIDSTVLGPAFGGIRRARYDSDDDACVDARRLARAMRDKCALAGLAAGGAKTVLRERAGAPWPEIYRALGRAVDELGGRYVCGPDVGTGAQELAWVREATRHCNPVANDPSASTAAGVLAAMRAVWPALGMSPRGATAVVQGLGNVGGRVARGLLELGARVYGNDPDADACARAAELGVTIVAAHELPTIACDVLSPCALGHAIDPVAAASWPTRAVCGAANNMLVPGAELVLHRRGVWVVPDPVSSAGAVIEGVLTVTAGDTAHTRARIAETIAAIEHTAAELLAASRRDDRPPAELASARARARLDNGRASQA
ncbi:MAG TPA: Glu/Leu/Phe/Val dehydrogenase dimerization domain-containing protein [Nannocystaceae bacterium]|nr:Glu/Leu/Phe/Val dehydrogenase dimerization domain-containing protein [Nannocystaceae bacterium]